MLYGSIIWNVFLIYAVMRYFLTSIQNLIINRRISLNGGFHTLQPSRLTAVVSMLAYNRPVVSVAYAYTAFWLIVNTIVFMILWAAMGWKVDISSYSLLISYGLVTFTPINRMGLPTSPTSRQEPLLPLWSSVYIGLFGTTTKH